MRARVKGALEKPSTGGDQVAGGVHYDNADAHLGADDEVANCLDDAIKQKQFYLFETVIQQQVTS